MTKWRKLGKKTQNKYFAKKYRLRSKGAMYLTISIEIEKRINGTVLTFFDKNQNHPHDFKIRQTKRQYAYRRTTSWFFLSLINNSSTHLFNIAIKAYTLSMYIFSGSDKMYHDSIWPLSVIYHTVQRTHSVLYRIFSVLIVIVSSLLISYV